MSDPLRDLLTHGRARLAGCPDPAREARILLAHAAGLPREALHRLADIAPDDALRAAYEAALARRAGGEPVARILGYRDFWRHRFRITPDVLDPRPETETLVAEALSRPFSRVLDLGTGSGCILLSLLAAQPGVTGLGTDLSAAALTVARDNAARLGLADRAAFAESDWFAGVTGRFDLIVSNPPYVTAAEMADLSPEVARHDPAPALTPGGDGLDAVRRIVAEAPPHLAPGGRLLVEIGWRQGAAAADLFREAGFARARVLPDLDGRDRVVAAVRPDPAD